MAYADAEQLARLLPGVNATTRADDLARVLEAAALEIDTELARSTPFDFSDAEGIAAYPLLVQVNLERAVEHWSQAQTSFGLVGLGDGVTGFIATDTWDRHAKKLAPLKPGDGWGVA